MLTLGVSRASKTVLMIAAALAGAALLVVAGASSDTSVASAATRGGGLSLTVEGSQASVAPRFGTRVLREGMAGPDVRVLKGIVRSKALLKGSSVSSRFDSPTTSAVRRFQKRADIATSGVVNRRTARRLVGSMSLSGASWYGPGLYGNRTACGQVYRPTTMGVAHKTLPCGSKVLIGYKGRFLTTRVIDRGPFVPGREWDLSNAARIALKFDGVGLVRHAVLSRR